MIIEPLGKSSGIEVKGLRTVNGSAVTDESLIPESDIMKILASYLDIQWQLTNIFPPEV